MRPLAVIVLSSALGPGAAVGAAPAATELSGRWEGFVEAPRRPVILRLTFRLRDRVWDGTAEVPGAGTVSLTDLRVELPDVRFSLPLGEPAIQFEGRLEGGILGGEARMGDRAARVRFEAEPEPGPPANRVEGWHRDGRRPPQAPGLRPELRSRGPRGLSAAPDRAAGGGRRARRLRDHGGPRPGGGPRRQRPHAPVPPPQPVGAPALADPGVVARRPAPDRARHPGHRGGPRRPGGVARRGTTPGACGRRWPRCSRETSPGSPTRARTSSRAPPPSTGSVSPRIPTASPWSGKPPAAGAARSRSAPCRSSRATPRERPGGTSPPSTKSPVGSPRP